MNGSTFPDWLKIADSFKQYPAFSDSIHDKRMGERDWSLRKAVRGLSRLRGLGLRKRHEPETIRR
jgi:hypothetical protein